MKRCAVIRSMGWFLVMLSHFWGLIWSVSGELCACRVSERTVRASSTRVKEKLDMVGQKTLDHSLALQHLVFFQCIIPHKFNGWNDADMSFRFWLILLSFMLKWLKKTKKFWLQQLLLMYNVPPLTPINWGLQAQLSWNAAVTLISKLGKFLMVRKRSVDHLVSINSRWVFSEEGPW